MGSRALYFYLPVLNLPTGTTHVFIMKNKLYLCGIRESCPTGQQVCFACRRGWQYPVSTKPSQRSGKAVLGVGNSVLCRRIAGKTQTAEEGTS